MELTRSGDVLAGRYRLTDLLSEARDGRFWRAEDGVLGRPVAIHVLDAHDERAPRLAAAARASASVNDARLLRVLDSATNDRITFVVNEWGTGTSLDNLLAADGPLPPRRAAWVASEITDVLAKAHALGHAHGRLNPENVLIDDLGAVRLIGFALEAALHGHEPHHQADIETDCVDAAAILYAALTGKWAGRTSSRVPAAPTDHGRLLRPRQVRAGVPRVLDDLCDSVLGQGAGVPRSAREQHAELTWYVGDSARVSPTSPIKPVALGSLAPAAPEPEAPSEAGDATQAMAAPDTESPTESPTDAGTKNAEGTTDHSPAPQAPGEPAPTEPGLPALDDWTSDDWTKPREDPAPPPPPLEPPAPKPLFADEPRRPRDASEQPDQATQSVQPVGEAPEPTYASSLGVQRVHRAQFAPDPATGDQTYWPWSGSQPELELDEPERVPGRRWLRLAIGVAVAAVLVVCIALGYNATQGKGPFAGGDSEESGSPSPTGQTAAPATVKGLTVKDFDPYGDPPNEYPDLVSLVLDGNPDTTWRTSTYKQQFGPGGLKPGLGLILDLKRTYAVDRLHLDLVGGPTGMSIYVSDRAPTQAPTGDPAATASLSSSGDVKLDGAPKGRFVTIWFTKLPAIGGGFRAEVGEVSVTASKIQ